MEIFEDVIILKILGNLSLKLFDVSTCTKSFLNFAQEDDNFNIVWALKWFNSVDDAVPHFEAESVQIFLTV